MRYRHRAGDRRVRGLAIPFPCRVLAVCAAALLLVSLAAGCKKQEVKEQQERILNVKVWTVEKRPFRPFVETIGSLGPDDEVTVSSEADGVLKSVRVDEGNAVGRGGLLAEVDRTDYQLDLQRGEAALRQSEATLANTRVELERKASLVKEELVTKQQYDDVKTRMLLAEAERERAKATLALVQQRLTKTRILAPLAGFVKDKKVSAGDFVRTGMPVFTIIRTDPLKLAFTVSEKDVATLRRGQELSFTVDAYPERAFMGRVCQIWPNLEERTRSLKVEALVPNPGHVLKPGLFARVTLYTDTSREVTVAPATAILYDGTRTRVFVKEGDRAREREVKAGAKFGELVEIREGLKPGEQLIVVGQNNLAEGTKVNVAR